MCYIGINQFCPTHLNCSVIWLLDCQHQCDSMWVGCL